MFAAVGLAAIHDLPHVEAVLEQVSQRAHAKSDAAMAPAIGQGAWLCPDATMIEVLGEGSHRAKLEVAVEDRSNRGGLFRDNRQLLFDARIAKRNGSSHPET